MQGNLLSSHASKYQHKPQRDHLRKWQPNLLLEKESRIWPSSDKHRQVNLPVALPQYKRLEVIFKTYLSCQPRISRKQLQV